MISVYLITLLINISPEEWSKSAWGEPPVKLEAEIVNPKSFYFTGEPIYLEWSFCNVSQKPVKTVIPDKNSFCNHLLKITGENEKGEVFTLHPRVTDEFIIIGDYEKFGTTFTPGDTFVESEDLASLFTNIGKGTFYLKYLIYDNTVFMESPMKKRPLSKPYWWGKTIFSLDFKLVVKHPQGEENKMAKLCREAETIEQYMMAVHTYPKSVYVPAVFDREISFAIDWKMNKRKEEEYSKLLKEVEWYIENFKDSPEHKFPKGYWDEWIEKSETIRKAIKEYKERNEK